MDVDHGRMGHVCDSINLLLLLLLLLLVEVEDADVDNNDTGILVGEENASQHWGVATRATITTAMARTMINDRLDTAVIIIHKYISFVVRRLGWLVGRRCCCVQERE